MNLLVRYSYRVFIFTLAFSAFTFITVGTGALCMTQALVYISLLLYCLAWLLLQEVSWHHPPGLVPLLLFFLYTSFQLLPLPPGLLQLLSPQTGALYQQTIWLVKPGTWMPLSVAPKLTMIALWYFGAGVALYCLTIQLLTHQDLLKKTAGFLVIFSTILAILVILDLGLVGAWFNERHYIGLLSMLLPVSAALFINYRPKIVYEATGWQRFSRSWTNLRGNAHLVVLCCGLCVTAAILLINPRAFLLVFVAFLVVCAGISTCRFWDIALRRKLAMPLSVLLFLAILWIACGTFFPGFIAWFEIEHEVDRPLVMESALHMIADFPLLGTGLGTFGEAYHHYSEAEDQAIVVHAYNSYLGLLAGSGLIGALLVSCFCYRLFYFTGMTLRQRRHRETIHLSYGFIIAIVVVSLQALGGFNWGAGANGLYIFLLCGLLISAVSERRNATAPHWLTATRRSSAFPMTGILLGLFLLSSWSCYGVWQAEKLYTVFKTEQQSDQQRLLIGEEKIKRTLITELIALDGWEPRYHDEQAKLLAMTGDEKQAQLAASMIAMQQQPLRCQYIQDVANEMMSFDSKIATLLYQASVDLIPKNVDCLRQYSHWLLSQEGPRSAILDLFSRLYRLKYADKKRLFREFQQVGVTSNEVDQILPSNFIDYVHYSRFLWQQGDREKAIIVYGEGILKIKEDRRLSVKHFLQGYEYYRQVKDLRQAEAIIRLGIEWLPEVSLLHELLGDRYREQGIDYRALEEYKRAMVLESLDRFKNSRVSKKIVDLQSLSGIGV